MSTAAPLQNTSTKLPLASNLSQAGLLLHRKCACGNSTMTGGECEACGKNKFQRKLSIGASNDPLEQEADRVADQVLTTPAHSAVSGATPRIQQFTGQATGDAGIAPSSVDRVLAGSGMPLDPVLQQGMGQRFGHDFSQVRVHSDVAAGQSAREVNAHAYTVGRDIVFGANKFTPSSHDGLRLIAHELTHVVQQSGARRGRNDGEHGLSPIPFPRSALPVYCNQAGTGVMRQLMRQQAQKPKASEPDDENVKELKIKIKALVKSRFDNDYRKAFDHYAGSNKVVDADEVKTLLEDAKIGNWVTRDAWVDGIMKKMDTDKDKKITWEEFQNGIN